MLTSQKVIANVDVNGYFVPFAIEKINGVCYVNVNTSVPNGLNGDFYSDAMPEQFRPNKRIILSHILSVCGGISTRFYCICLYAKDTSSIK